MARRIVDAGSTEGLRAEIPAEHGTAARTAVSGCPERVVVLS